MTAIHLCCCWNYAGNLVPGARHWSEINQNQFQCRKINQTNSNYSLLSCLLIDRYLHLWGEPYYCHGTDVINLNSLVSLMQRTQTQHSTQQQNTSNCFFIGFGFVHSYNTFIHLVCMCLAIVVLYPHLHFTKLIISIYLVFCWVSLAGLAECEGASWLSLVRLAMSPGVPAVPATPPRLTSGDLSFQLKSSKSVGI